MKIIYILLGCLLVGFAPKVYSQSFQNMDFEQANISPAPAGYIPTYALNPISAADALPYWTVREDTTVCTAVSSSPGLDQTFVYLAPVYNYGYASHPSLQGAFSIELSASGLDTYKSASISQTGLVPAGTRSIQFQLRTYLGGPGVESLIVTLNGTPVNFSTFGGVMNMAGDVSAFAGTTAELTFTATSFSNYMIDSIVFSSQAVPEPSTLTLLTVGGLFLGWRWRKSSRA